MGENLSNQKWLFDTFEILGTFKEVMKRFQEFKVKTKGVDSCTYFDDVTFPCHHLGGVGYRSMEAEYTSSLSDCRTDGVDHVVSTAWGANLLTVNQRLQAQIMIAAGSSSKAHCERRSDDENRNEDGLADIKTEIGRDLAFLNLSVPDQLRVVCCLQAGHEHERKRMLEFNPGVGVHVLIIRDGEYFKSRAMVRKITKKSDGRRYLCTLKGDSGKSIEEKFKRGEFVVEGHFAGRVFVNVREPTEFLVYYRTYDPLNSETCPGMVLHAPSPEPQPLPNAFNVKVDSNSDDDGDSSSDGETDEDEPTRTKSESETEAGDGDADDEVVYNKPEEDAEEESEETSGSSSDEESASEDEGEVDADNADDEYTTTKDKKRRKKNKAVSSSVCVTHPVHCSQTVLLMIACVWKVAAVQSAAETDAQMEVSSESTNNDYEKLIAEGMAKLKEQAAATAILNSKKRKRRLAAGLETMSQVSNAVTEQPSSSTPHPIGARVIQALNSSVHGTIAAVISGDSTTTFLYSIDLTPPLHANLFPKDLDTYAVYDDDNEETIVRLTSISHNVIDVEEGKVDEKVSVATVCFHTCNTISNSLSVCVDGKGFD